MLLLIGIGLWDETDISLKGLTALAECDAAYAEAYTNRMSEGTLDRLGDLAEKKISVLTREQVEDGKKLVAEAMEKDVVLLVPGDPMISTTHVSLVLQARKEGVDVALIHGCSILSAAIGVSGLQTYKFGKPVTLAHWSENYKPTSTYDTLKSNQERGLHTLLFLDLKEGEPMPPKEAVELLMKLEQEVKGGLISDDTKLIVLSRVGGPGQKITYGELGGLKAAELGEPPSIIILPGKLHFMEEEALEGL